MRPAAARGQQLHAASSCTRPTAARSQQLHEANSCTRPAAAQGQQLHEANSCTRPAAARGQQLHAASSCTRPAAARGQQLHEASSCMRPAAARGQQLHEASSCMWLIEFHLILSSNNYRSTTIDSLLPLHRTKMLAHTVADLQKRTIHIIVEDRCSVSCRGTQQCCIQMHNQHQNFSI